MLQKVVVGKADQPTFSSQHLGLDECQYRLRDMKLIHLHLNFKLTCFVSLSTLIHTIT